jgi:hypothetical protein
MFTPFDSHFLSQAERSRTGEQQLAEDVLAAELMRSVAHRRAALARAIGLTSRLLGRGSAALVPVAEDVAEQARFSSPTTW